MTGHLLLILRTDFPRSLFPLGEEEMHLLITEAAREERSWISKTFKYSKEII